MEAIAHGGLRFPEIKDKLENLERQKEHLKSQLDEVRVQIARQAREKFDAQIVFNTLKDFTQRIESSSPEERISLLQYLYKRRCLFSERDYSQPFLPAPNEFEKL